VAEGFHVLGVLGHPFKQGLAGVKRLLEGTFFVGDDLLIPGFGEVVWQKLGAGAGDVEPGNKFITVPLKWRNETYSCAMAPAASGLAKTSVNALEVYSWGPVSLMRPNAACVRRMRPICELETAIHHKQLCILTKQLGGSPRFLRQLCQRYRSFTLLENAKEVQVDGDFGECNL
jgi:hypothetical protein